MSDNQPMDKLKGVSQDLVKNLGGKALGMANDSLDGLSDKLSGLAEGGGVAGQTVAKAGKAKAEGDNPVLGGLKGAASGIKDKVTGGGSSGSGGGEATKSTNIIESIDVGVPLSRRLQPVDRVRRLPHVHEEGRERPDGGRRDQDQVEGADLPQPPRVGVHDPRAGARREDRVALQRREGPRRRCGHLPRAVAQPDPHPGGPRVLPPGVLREDRKPLARTGPTGPRRAAPLPSSCDDPNDSRARRGRGLARRHRGRRGGREPRGGRRARGGGRRGPAGRRARRGVRRRRP